LIRGGFKLLMPKLTLEPNSTGSKKKKKTIYNFNLWFSLISYKNLRISK
jgi:hypothetical protein